MRGRAPGELGCRRRRRDLVGARGRHGLFRRPRQLERGHRGGRLHDAAASTPVTALVGRKVLRAAPWPVLLGGCVAAATLFGIAAALRNGPLVFPLSLLGSGCAAPPRRTSSTRTPPRWRTRRLPDVALGWAGGSCSRSCRSPWAPRPAPARRRGRRGRVGQARAGRGRERGGWDRVRVGAPSYGAVRARRPRWALALGVVVLVVANEPLHWVSLAPLESSTYPLSTAVAWSIVLLACAAVLGRASAIPADRPSEGRCRGPIAHSRRSSARPRSRPSARRVARDQRPGALLGGCVARYPAEPGSPRRRPARAAMTSRRAEQAASAAHDLAVASV